MMHGFFIFCFLSKLSICGFAYCFIIIRLLLLFQPFPICVYVLNSSIEFTRSHSTQKQEKRMKICIFCFSSWTKRTSHISICYMSRQGKNERKKERRNWRKEKSVEFCTNFEIYQRCVYMRMISDQWTLNTERR